MIQAVARHLGLRAIHVDPVTCQVGEPAGETSSLLPGGFNAAATTSATAATGIDPNVSAEIEEFIAEIANFQRLEDGQSATSSGSDHTTNTSLIAHAQEMSRSDPQPTIWQVDSGGALGFRNSPDHKDTTDPNMVPPAKPLSKWVVSEEKEGWIRTTNGLWLPTKHMVQLAG